jgi:hypothetical protein
MQKMVNKFGYQKNEMEHDCAGNDTINHFHWDWHYGRTMSIIAYNVYTTITM